MCIECLMALKAYMNDFKPKNEMQIQREIPELWANISEQII